MGITTGAIENGKLQFLTLFSYLEELVKSAGAIVDLNTRKILVSNVLQSLVSKLGQYFATVNILTGVS